MITRALFWSHSSAAKSPSTPTPYYISGEPQQLLMWSASLPRLSEPAQVAQITQVLTELATLSVDDERRLHLMAIVMTAADRLIAAMHRDPVFAPSITKDSHADIKAAQAKLSAQIQSLYSLGILVYEHIISNQRGKLGEQYRSETKLWQRFILATQPKTVLTIAIYQALLTYQKLIYERAVCEERSPQHRHLWSELNKLYKTAHAYQVSHIDVTTHITTRRAPSIHALYSQICLYQLLQVRAMHPASRTLLQRLLPSLAPHMTATIEPQSATRVFVALDSAAPPQYFDAGSPINPYADEQLCLFFELSPLVTYLSARIHEQYAGIGESAERLLLNKVRLIVSHRYLERPTTIPSKSSPKQPATLMNGFYDIHYHVAGGRHLAQLLTATACHSHIPLRYQRQPEHTDAIAAHTFDSTDIASHYRVIQLAEDTARPSSLRLFDLMLLCRPNAALSFKWSLGMVRAIHIAKPHIEIEWQVLAHQVTACALSVQRRTDLQPKIVPAFLLIKDPHLQRDASIIVPAYHFCAYEQVTIYLGAQQQTIQLGACLLQMQNFSQFSFNTL